VKPPAQAGRWLLVAGLVALALLLVVVGVVYLELPAGKVSVSSIHLSAPTDPCGLNGANLVGFTADEGASVHESVTVHNANSTSSCTVRSMTSATSGFSVASFTPVEIPPGSNGTLVFSIQVPDSAFSGSLTLDLS